jgi:hypothetical protein
MSLRGNLGAATKRGDPAGRNSQATLQRQRARTARTKPLAGAEPGRRILRPAEHCGYTSVARAPQDRLSKCRASAVLRRHTQQMATVQEAANGCGLKPSLAC